MTELSAELAHWPSAESPVPVTLNGHWVTLEPLSAERHSCDLWSAVRGHDELWTYLFDGPFGSEAALREAVVGKEASGSMCFFAIVPKGKPGETEPKARGWASYLRIEPEHGVIEVGNIVFSPALQRTAAATEAMYLMARHVFEDLGYRRYEWKCNALNLPSRLAAARLGFTFEGIFRQHMVVKGRNRDTAWFAMMDHEWPTRKRAFEAWLAPGNFGADGRQLRDLASFKR